MAHGKPLQRYVVGGEDRFWAVYCDGAGGYVQGSANINSTATDEDEKFSCSVWFKPATVTGNQAIFGKGGSMRLFIDGTDLKLDLRDGANVFFNDTVGSAAIGTADVWYHVLISGSNAAGVMTCYVNGVQTYNDESFSASDYNADDFDFDIGSSNGSTLYTGWVSELWINNGFLDFRESSSRALFVDADTNRAVSLGTDGSTPLGGTVPWGYWPLRNGNPYMYTRYNGASSSFANLVGVSYTALPVLAHG